MSALVLLVTSRDWPDGEPGHDVLDAALARRGVDSRWVCWDDQDVDWSAAGAVAVRSTWDYEHRLDDFLAWSDRVGPALLNGAAVFRWNTDKRYLLQLADAGLPVVPTLLVDGPDDVAAAVARFGSTVVKPRVAAGGRGLSVVDDAGRWEPDRGGPWLAQPVVESVRTEGETSVFVLGGRATSQVRKVATADDVRVHSYYGGTTTVVDLDDDAAALAARTVEAVEALLGADLAYARVDLLRHEGRLVVSELEATEPGLYLDELPANGDAFADVVGASLQPRGPAAR